MNFTYDKEQLVELMNDFYSLTKIKTALYDHSFNSILEVPEKDSVFCSAVKTTENGRKNCDLCTKNAIEEVRKKNALIVYQCHAGLIEAVAPIRINGVIVGYMMFGQIFENSHKKSDKADLLSHIAEYEIKDVDNLIKALTAKSHSEIKAAAKIMESCVCYLLMNNVIKESDGSIAFEINVYIKEHLHHSLTAKELCENFKISRNMLYKIAETYFGMPIAKYINLQRIEKAKELIKEGVAMTKVAELTGFCDYVYFGKVFKKLTGTTPGTFADK